MCENAPSACLFLSHLRRALHLRLKLPFGDTNDRGGCYHIAPSDICTHTHTCKDSCYFLWLRACVHLLLDHAVSPSRRATAPLPSLPLSPPFLYPCNSTLPTLVSRLLANTDCLRPGLDFPVLTSLLVRFISHSIWTPTPHPLSLMCFSSPVPSFFSCAISKNICVFRKHATLAFLLLSLLKSRTLFLFPTSDWFLFVLPLLSQERTWQAERLDWQSEQNFQLTLLCCETLVSE